MNITEGKPSWKYISVVSATESKNYRKQKISLFYYAYCTHRAGVPKQHTVCKLICKGVEIKLSKIDHPQPFSEIVM